MITPQDIQRALLLRRFRLQDTVKEDVSWDVLIPTGGATFSFNMQCLVGKSVNINWGDDSSTEATSNLIVTYSHTYPAGTYTIVLTGGVQGIKAGYAVTDKKMMRAIRNLNSPGFIYMYDGFNYATNSFLVDGCRLASTVTNIFQIFLGNAQITVFPNSFQLPAGIVLAQNAFYATGLTYVPLSLWPSGGFTYSSEINIKGLFYKSNSIANSIAPSQLLWDSGKTFGVDRGTFYPNNSTAWLNYSQAYTDPVSGITYSKIPYSWGGDVDP